MHSCINDTRRTIIAICCQAEALGYNLDVLAPQNFNEVMYTGFREVINGMRSPAEQAGALQQAWAEARNAGKTPAQE
jgi:hypothetical protein